MFSHSSKVTYAYDCDHYNTVCNSNRLQMTSVALSVALDQPESETLSITDRKLRSSLRSEMENCPGMLANGKVQDRV